MTVKVQLRVVGSVGLTGPRSTQNSSQSGGGVQENTWQHREAKEANVIYLVFLTNISANFLNLTVMDSPLGLGALKTSCRYFPLFKKTSFLPREIATRRLQGTTKPPHFKTTV